MNLVPQLWGYRAWILCQRECQGSEPESGDQTGQPGSEVGIRSQGERLGIRDGADKKQGQDGEGGRLGVYQGHICYCCQLTMGVMLTLIWQDQWPYSPGLYQKAVSGP